MRLGVFFSKAVGLRALSTGRPSGHNPVPEVASMDASDQDGFYTGPPCPVCGTALWFWEPGDARFECHNPSCSGGSPFFEVDGELLDARTASQRAHTPDRCDWCQASLTGSDHNLPYEDGSTPYAYITCRSCGGENMREGFGAD